MTPFEYVSVLISLILGLGLTLILSGIARIIKRWETIQPFGPYFIWISLAFVLHIHEWWETYQLTVLSSWSMPMFLFVILYPILLFILANLLFPSRWPKSLDLKEFYFSICHKFFLFTILLSVVAILQNIFLLNYSLSEQLVQLAVIATFSTMLIWKPKNIIVHYSLALALLFLMIGSLVFTSDTLIIK